VEVGRRKGRGLWGAGAPVEMVERRVRGWDHRRNVNLTFKKLDLRTWTKPISNAEETNRAMVEP
jgi:hypothetical protein